MEAAAVRLYCARVMHFSAFHLLCTSVVNHDDVKEAITHADMSICMYLQDSSQCSCLQLDTYTVHS